VSTQTFRHFLVKDGTPGSHPLYVTGCDLPYIAKAILVTNQTSQHVRDGLNPAMRMHGETTHVIFRVMRSEMIKQEKRIEVIKYSGAHTTA